MARFPKEMVLGCALLCAAGALRATEENAVVARHVLPTAMVKCPGVTSIPLTADAEQVLPLQIVGALTCGSTVAVLSDNEGYTARVRTAEGMEGYVARMYLAADDAAPAMPPNLQPSMATPTNGVVRWQAGAPGCVSFLSRGRHVESMTANGITVQVSLQDTGWKFRANVAVSNQGASAALLQPGIVSLDELQPNLRPLRASDARKMTHIPTHQVLWTAATAEPSPSAVEPRLLHRSEVQRLAERTAATPDYLDPHMVLASDHPLTFGRSPAVDIGAIALKPVSLAAGETTAGVMWFERDPSAREVSLRVPVGDLVFDFAFAFEQNK